MAIIGINGFGRIGRLALRTALLNYPDVKIAVVNTSGSMDIQGWYTLFNYDSTYGRFTKHIDIKSAQNDKEIGRLIIEGKEIVFTAFRNPDEIPWNQYGVETVLESTGVFLTKEKAEKHKVGGAKLIILSAPPKDDQIPLYMLGVSDVRTITDSVISNCSCTTYSAASVVKTIYDHFGIEHAHITTVHAYTSDQTLLDNSHKDLRRARSAGVNIIPTSSGAAKAVIAIIPELKGKFEACALRVPVVTGSISECTFIIKRPTTKEEVNTILTQESEGRFQGIMGVTRDPIVSSDIIGTSESAIVDLSLTSVVDGTLLNVYSWYDNEWSYACRLIELAKKAVQ